MNEWIRVFEMSIARDELFRRLPEALGGAACEAAGNRFLHHEAERRWSLTLHPLPALELGSLRLERHTVVWRFSGYSLTEIGRLRGLFRSALPARGRVITAAGRSPCGGSGPCPRGVSLPATG